MLSSRTYQVAGFYLRPFVQENADFAHTAKVRPDGPHRSIEIDLWRSALSRTFQVDFTDYPRPDIRARCSIGESGLEAAIGADATSRFLG